MKELLGLSAWHGIGRVGSASPLTGMEMGLPRMSLPKDAPEFHTMQALLDTKPTDSACEDTMELKCAVKAAAGTALPVSTTDVAQLRSDIEKHGYCIIADALRVEELRALQTRTCDQAAAEAAAGVGSLGKYGNPCVFSLANKGDEFVTLLLHMKANHVVRYVLGEEYQLSHATASLRPHDSTKPGGKPPLHELHMEQWFLPQPLHKATVVPSIRPGSVRPEIVESVATASQDVIAPAVCLDVLWALGTLTPTVVPGSHKAGRHPTKAEATAGGKAVGDVAIRCNPGDCLIMDGRLWQSTGSPQAATYLQYSYCGPQFRARENHQLTIRPEVLAALPEVARACLGFRSWNSYGR